MTTLGKTVNNLIINNFTDEEAAELKDDLAFAPLDTSFLPPRERVILEQREKGLTLEQIARTYGLTRERIRQLELGAQQKVISRLRTRLAKINVENLADLVDDKRLPAIEKDLIIQLRNKIPVLKKLITYIESLEQLVPEATVNESLLNQKIEVLDLSVRSYNGLRRTGIETLRDLTQCSVTKLKKIHSLGYKSIMEIIHKAGDLGLTIPGGDY